MGELRRQEPSEHRSDDRAEPEPVPAGRVHPGRPPRLQRVGRTAAVVGVVGFLLVLAYLTTRYSHGVRPPEEEPEARPPAVTAPLSADRIEEYARRLTEGLRAGEPAPEPPDLGFPEDGVVAFGEAGPGPRGRGPASPPPPPPASPPVRELPALRSPLSPGGGRGVPAGAGSSPPTPGPGPGPAFWEELRSGFSRAYPGVGSGEAASGEVRPGWEAPARVAAPGSSLPSSSRPGAASPDGRRPVELPSLEVHRVERSGVVGRRVLATGTVVPLVLTHELSTDVPGPVRAWVSRDVYDSGSHTVLLIPRGTLVTGMQSGRTAPGDRRVLIAWRRLRLPSGETYVLPDLPAGSVDGTAGARGAVDSHWWGRFGNAVALSLVGAAAQLSQPQERTSVQGYGASEGQVLAQQLGLELGRLSREVLRRGLDRPPTIHLPAGHRLSLLLTRDLAF